MSQSKGAPENQEMNRRVFIRQSGQITFGAALSVVGGQSLKRSIGKQIRRPNVILIATDDLGYGDLGCYGNSKISTPHINALAAKGIILTQHYSASPKCAPARASLLTGRYNHRTGAVDVPSNRGLDRIALRETTLADALRKKGYITGMVGKWHNGAHDMRYHPKSRGFDEFVGFLHGGMDYWQWVLDDNGRVRRADGRHLTDVFTDESIKFIQRHKKSPFFLYISYNAPHSPFQGPEELIQKYEKNESLTRQVSILYAMIEQIDTGVGKILEILRELQIAGDTFIVFVSDQGPSLGGNFQRYNGPFRGGKGLVLEGGVRIPGIACWPGKIPAGVTSNELVHFIDWFPTIVAAGGGQTQSVLPLDGQNIMSVLQGKRRNLIPGQCWYWQHNRYKPIPYCNAAIRQEKWKLYWPPIPKAMLKLESDHEPYYYGLTHAHRLMEINCTLPQRNLPSPQSPQLYNLEEDPGERMDLASEYPKRVIRMKQKWETWFEEVITDWQKAWTSIVET